MGLLGNYSVLLKSCGNFVSGATISDNRANWNTSGHSRRYYFGAYGQKNALPNGYRMPNSWVMAQKSGEMSIYTGLTLANTVALTLAGGKNGAADLTIGVSISNAQLGLIVAALADLSMAVSTNATLIGKAEATASLTISVATTASLTALAEAIASLNISVNVTASQYAVGSLSADITSNTTLSPENLATAVWNSVAALFNNAGTMGEIMNNVGAGADPWATLLPGAYGVGTAGEIVGNGQAPSVTEIVDGVWDEQKAGHVTANSYGKIVQDLETLIKQVKALTAAGL